MTVDFRTLGHTHGAVHMHDATVERVHSNKYLGAIFEDILKWDLNTEAITEKRYDQQLHLLRKLRFYR